MKVVVFLTILGLAAAVPLPQEDEAPLSSALLSSAPPREDKSSLNSVPILRNSRIGPDGDGNFNFRYETGDGIVHEAQGTNGGDGIVRVSGSFSYLSPEGEPIEISYTADENGFQAVGSAVPTTPAVPAHALAQLKAAEEAFAKQDVSVVAQPDVAPPAQSPVDRDAEGRPG